MGQVAAGGAPARHGVFRVIVLIALMTLLHATHVPGAAHRAAPDSDRCVVGPIGPAAWSGAADVPGDGPPGDHSVRGATPAGEPGGRHGPAVGPARTPAAARPRHHSTTASASALVDTVGSRLAASAEVGEIRARTATGIPDRSLRGPSSCAAERSPTSGRRRTGRVAGPACPRSFLSPANPGDPAMPLDTYLLLSALVRAEAARSAATAGTAATSDTPSPVAGSGKVAADAATRDASMPDAATRDATTLDADPTAVGSPGADRRIGPQPPSAAPRS